eukprot:TRINITY_DN16830_c1_g1_i1.p1 TRINITY_DN16830_c1_g1~~TRINITY_DN16830_c1_g1_i1.p1  ORF type:complete len:362 (-),score=65.58 TRINITY_DN16830_c1_g1_i1:146-1099(-)
MARNFEKNIPTPEALMRWIIESLYLDEAIPKGYLLHWYYHLLTGVKLSHAQIVNLLQATPGVAVDPPISKRLAFRVILKDPPAGFTGFVEEDVERNPLPVSPPILEKINGLLAVGGWSKPEDPLCRYIGVATWLQDADPALKEITLGRLLQVVRHATHHSSLLGHRDGHLVPYSESEELERLNNASAGKPTAVNPDEDYVQTWAELKEGLRYLIAESGVDEIEVSKIKLLFRSSLGKELSETVFGHCALSKLFLDPELGDDFMMDQVAGEKSSKKGGVGMPSRLLIKLKKKKGGSPKKANGSVSAETSPIGSLVALQ